MSLWPRILLSGAVLGATLYPLRHLNFWLVGVIGVVTYGILLLVTKTLSLETLKTIISNRVETSHSLPTE
jgi:hypothetical protein